jgi:hypothetical protein
MLNLNKIVLNHRKRFRNMNIFGRIYLFILQENILYEEREEAREWISIVILV